MKAELKNRPQSKRIKTQAATDKKQGNNLGKAEEYFKNGKLQQLSNKFQKAIQLYIRTVGFNPQYFQAFCNMGYCYRALGKYPEAKRCYLNALSINQQDNISHYNLANLYRIIGQNEHAIEQYLIIINRAQLKNGEINSLYLNSLINIGVCFKNEGRIEEAIKINKKVIEISPNQIEAMFNLGICLLLSIQFKKNTQFQRLIHERALQSKIIFEKILSKNQKNYMAQLSLIKANVHLNKTQKFIEQSVSKLKQMLNVPQCNIIDEIKYQIGVYLNLLKNFEASAKYYQGSLKGLTRKQSSKIKQAQSIIKVDKQIDNILKQFEEQQQQQDILITEALGIALIEQKQYKIVEQKIKQLSEKNILKQTLLLILYANQADQVQSYYEKALNIFHKYFDKDQNELPFNSLSLEAHKCIGKILAYNKQFQKSIKHYEYISQKLANNQALSSAKIHNELGEGFEEIGSFTKAIIQYKKAIQIQPDNLQLTYNMGYCFYESGNNKQASQYFTTILQKIKKDNNLSAQAKQLYETDVMIILALSNQDLTKKYQLCIDAFQRFRKLKSRQNVKFDSLEQNLMMFLIETGQILQEKLSTISPSNQQFQKFALQMLQVYQQFLALQNCPDVDQIKVNSANLYYQLRQYVSAVYFYEQINNVATIPRINYSLAYAHIFQPAIALKNINQSCIQDKDDQINKFCKQILQWIYFNQNQGKWNGLLPKFTKDMFYQRNQYGLFLIQSLTQFINRQQFIQDSQIQIIAQIVKNDDPSFFEQTDVVNLKKSKFLNFVKNCNNTKIQSDKITLSSQILDICFKQSSKISEDFANLMILISNLPKSGRQCEIFQSVIYLFIYRNQIESLKIDQLLRQYIKKSSTTINIKSQKYKAEDQVLLSIENLFKDTKQLILGFKEWQYLLQKSYQRIIQIIKKQYYDSNISKVLQYQYHFPRHSNLFQADETFQKIVNIARKVMKYENSISCKGNNLKQMRLDMIKQFQINFDIYLSKNTRNNINISNQFLPVTVYSTHQNKIQCQKFINSLLSVLKVQPIKIDDKCDQFNLVIDRLVKLQCKWGNPWQSNNILKQVIQGITDCELFIVSQSIIYLEKGKDIIIKDNLQAKNLLKLDNTLNY